MHFAAKVCYNSNEPMKNASVLQNFLSVLTCGGSVCVSLQLCYKLKIPLTFKKFNGISPWEYITIKRVENAVELIKNTNMTKLEIAEKCGFSSSSNFYKAFFNITGKKPSDYSPNK